MLTLPILRLLACALFAASALLSQSVQAQNITPQQLKALAPDENDLGGFVRLQLSRFQPSQDAAGSDSDYVELNHDVTQWAPGRLPTPERSGKVNRLRRNFASADGHYALTIEVRLCDTPEAAAEELANFRKGAQVLYQPGTPTGGPRIGDESWFASKALLCRSGWTMIFVNGDENGTVSQQSDEQPFPPAAVEAVAYQVLLRASQQTALTGVSSQNAHLAVNGRALPKNALRVAGRVYVPVKEFARAMGLTSGWDTKTGTLTLSGTGRKSVALTAGSTQATVGGVKAASLTVPVLKSGGEPVMALDDLLRLTGGRITGHAGDTVQIKG